jgi:glycosyltransferase involved in cell wall biosynthesis
MLCQSCTDLELLIIDDFSTDSTREVVSSYEDERIRFIKKKKNTGHITSLNLGIKIARGVFLARMDGDDISHPARIEKQVDFLKANPGVALCGTWYELLYSKEIVKNPVDARDVKIALLDFCALGHPTVMFRKDFFTVNKLTYDPASFPAEDYDLWTRVAPIGNMANLPETLLSYRIHDNQISVKAQTGQVKNANQCKIRMMCYPIANPADSDLKTSALIVKNAKMSDSIQLQEVVSWLDCLFDANKRSAFYAEQAFKKYIAEKKTAIIRGFYLHNSPYNPKTLYRFYKSAQKFHIYFTLVENLKFMLKCILCWK